MTAKMLINVIVIMLKNTIDIIAIAVEDSQVSSTSEKILDFKKIHLASSVHSITTLWFNKMPLILVNSSIHYCARLSCLLSVGWNEAEKKKVT